MIQKVTWHQILANGDHLSPCSASCGNGTKTQTRTCNGPFYGGNSCPTNQSIQFLHYLTIIGGRRYFW